MSVEAAIYSLLTTTPSSAGDRIYPVILPEGCSFPAIRYQRISTVRWNTLDNANDTPNARFEVSCWAEDFPDAIILEVAVRAALAGFSGTIGDTTIQHCVPVDSRDGWEFQMSTAGLFRRDVDFEIAYTEP